MRRSTKTPASRRRAGAAIVAFSVLLSGALASPAAAGTDWCENDPIVAIPGHTATLVTQFPSDYRSTLSHPLVYVILVPRSILSSTTVDARAASLPTVASVAGVDDAQWAARYGEADFAVRLYVAANANFQTFTKVSGRNAGELTRPGKSNSWIEFSYSFTPSSSGAEGTSQLNSTTDHNAND